MIAIRATLLLLCAWLLVGATPNTLRTRITEVVERNGGLLGSNLATVELTLALHTVFDSPNDKLIFDIGHQTYAHKLLTQRDDHRFDAIGKQGGFNRFSRPSESPHDPFLSGHAGTALSLALGMAQARDLSGDGYHIIPIIGDATLTCGLILEALHHIPAHLSNFIIVLNDNAQTKPNPLISETFFSQFGLTYVGPIDGHDSERLIALFSKWKNHPKPLIIHLHTQKPKCASSAPAETTFSRLFRRYLVELEKQEGNLAVVSPAMPLKQFKMAYPDRFFDVGIAEGHAVTFAAGLAKCKTLKVFCPIWSSFSHRAFDNIFHDVALQQIPVIFAIERAGFCCERGAAHHGIYDLGFLKALPHLVICQPRDGQLLKELMSASLQWDSPTVIRYSNHATNAANTSPTFRSLGKGEILARGDDVLLIALGDQTTTAQKVRDRLLKKGISTTIIDPIFIKPLDEELLKQEISRHSLTVTLEEHAVKGGFGQEISQLTQQKVLNLGIPDHYFDHDSENELLNQSRLSVEAIEEQINLSLRLRGKKREA